MKTLLLFAGMLSSFMVSAQLTYTFNVFSDTYVEFDDGTDAVVGSWDDPDMILPLGFEANIAGSNTSTLYFLGDFLGGTAVMDPFAPQWDMLWVTTADLTDAGYFNDEYLSPITYKTEGEPGSRIFKMQWQDSGFYGEVSNGTANNLINLQLWIYEGTNVIEVRWGPNTIKETEVVLFDWFSCGLIENATEEGVWTDTFLVAGDPAAPSIVSATTEDEIMMAQLTGIPSNGTVYQFSNSVVNVEEEAKAEFEVFPTYTQEMVTLATNGQGQTNYRVFDLGGKVVDQGQFQNRTQISFADFQQGIYLVELENGLDRTTTRVVKQ